MLFFIVLTLFLFSAEEGSTESKVLHENKIQKLQIYVSCLAPNNVKLTSIRMVFDKHMVYLVSGLALLYLYGVLGGFS